MHNWTEAETVAALVLAKLYEKAGWEDDPLTKILITGHGITKGSIRMAIQNYLHLMGKPGGLSKSSRRQKEIFAKYGNLSSAELRRKAEQLLDDRSAS